ncbi:MAG: hypothetical protein HUJ22_05010 [Gracilimonas sp.]|uniref:hypothetical protein n=1 Tax=Gracilimonas sp. TaxID=1974203 RepID=UPI0019CF3C44|nr:hypothetical protein [Gracilimonas sp.]MBD3615914.1 hypothetical protein [Gracilimonas sp.]
MADVKLSNLEKKKQELEDELIRIQGGIDKSIDEVKEEVSSNMDPKNLIKKYPLSIVGASIVAGFLLGRERKNYRRTSSKRYSSDSVPDSGITKELKRMLAKKGLSLLMDYLDDKVTSMKEKNKGSED